MRGRRRCPCAEVPPDQQRLDRRARATGELKDVGGRGPDRDLEDPGSDDGTGKGHEHRSGLVGRAQLPEPIRAVATHEGQVRQRLDVLHEGGAALQAAFGHSGRLPQWDRDASTDPVDDSARLAGDETVSGGHDAELRAVKADRRRSASAASTLSRTSRWTTMMTSSPQRGWPQAQHRRGRDGVSEPGAPCPSCWPARPPFHWRRRTACRGEPTGLEACDRSGTRRHHDRQGRHVRFRPRSLLATVRTTGAAPGRHGVRGAPPASPPPTARVAGASGCSSRLVRHHVIE